MNRYFSWFSEPDRVKAGDLGLSIVSTLLVLLLGPEEMFRKSNIDWTLYVVVCVGMFVVGLFSACAARRKDPEKPSRAFINASWFLAGGLVALPVCFFFRRIALDFAVVIFLVGFALMLGDRIQRLFVR